MADHKLFTLTNLDSVSSARLNRVRVRVTFDLTEEGEGHATVPASLAEDGTVILPENVKASARPLSAQVVDVRGGVLQDIDLSGVDVRLGAPIAIDAAERLKERLSESGPTQVPMWTRNGRFTVMGKPGFSFDGAQLFIAPASGDAATSTFRALGGSGDPPAQWHRPVTGDLAGMPVHPFQVARIGFDGRFDFQTSVPADADGWVWMLSGPFTFVGFTGDTRDLVKVPHVAIVLEVPGAGEGHSSGTEDEVETPSESTPTSGVRPSMQAVPPLDATEAEILDHAELFSDDPGPYCEPFRNPGRILGERRFHTVLRVEQPEIAAAAGIRLEATADRIREAGERLLEEGVESGIDLGEIGDLGLGGRSAFNPESIRAGFRSSLLDPAGPGRGRSVPGAANLIDWEGDTSGNQAVTVAGGHILDWRMRWRSNGYSLGNVNHTLTLAPRQIKRIMKIDWERREASARREELRFEEEVDQGTESSRDYYDAVESSLSEWSKGSSTSKMKGLSAGFGKASSASATVAPGVVVSGGNAFGIGGGFSRADLEAEQKGERDVAASEEQKLRDAIRQHGESLRRLESTVITETAQEESVEGVSEVIANPNFCHALSVIYYDILRHLRVDTELAGLSECLFVPFALTPFSHEVMNVGGWRFSPGLNRVLRYRDALRPTLRDRSLRWVFRYLEDYVRNGNEDIPDMVRMKQPLVELSGVLELEIYVASPLTGDEDERASEPENGERPPLERIVAKTVSIINKAFQPFKKFFGFGKPPSKLAKTPTEDREKVFQQDFAPAMARHLVDRLRLRTSSGSEELTADFTLDGKYRPGAVHRVHFTADPAALTGVTPESLSSLRAFIAGDPVATELADRWRELLGLPTSDSTEPRTEFLAVPGSSYVNVKGIRVHYRTEHYERSKTSPRGVGDLLQTALSDEDVLMAATDPDGALLSLRPDAFERQNLKDEIHKGVLDLVAHLNSHIHYYHKQIWWRMDRDELYQLLDGYMLSARDTRSIASVVERRPLAILGNTVVFRVARGAFVGVGGFDSLKEARAQYQQDATPADPMRISLPTGGVYAQALKDPCNACEEHYGNTDWVLEREEILPQEIESGLLSSRRAEPSGLQPTQLPQTLINLQNAPAPPSPSGFDGVLGAVTNAGSFRDLADVAGTQANARAALESSRQLATEFGNLAAKQADANRAAMERIEVARISAEGKEIASRPLKDGDNGGGDGKDGKDGKDSEDTGDDGRDGDDKGDGETPDPVRPDETDKGGTSQPRPRPRPRTNQYFRVLSPTHVLFFNFPIGGDEPADQHLTHIRGVLGRIEGARSVQRIQGHASRTGSDADNLDLSQRRAMGLLHLFEEHSGQSWPRAIAEGVGENEPTVRSTWETQLQDIPGRGHVEDPAERSVLVEFVAPVFEEQDTPDPVTEVDVVFIDDKNIRIGDFIVHINNDNSVHVVEGDTAIDVDVTHGDQIVNNEVYTIEQTNINVEVNLTGDVVTVDQRKFYIVEGTLQKDPDVGRLDVAGDLKSRNWEIMFKTPVLGDGESLFDVLRRFARDIILEKEAEETPPAGEPSFLGSLLPDTIDVVSGEFDDLVDFVIDQLLDEVLEKLPNPALILARVVRFGSAKVPVTIRNPLSGEALDGTLRGQAMTIGTQGSADPKTLNAEKKDYSTAEPRTLASWDGETMRTCSLVLQPVSQMVSQLFSTLEFVARWAEGSLGLDWIDAVSDRLDELLKSSGLDRVQDSLAHSQIQFQADEGERVHLYPATAPSVDITAIFFGRENASFEAD